jgi:DNA (cytosine-5)-methyltransferase 1
MKHISFFSGQGGFDLGAEWAGWDNLASCEINPFGHRILQYYWPNAYHHRDIKTLTYEILNEELTKRFGTHWRADGLVCSGGFP